MILYLATYTVALLVSVLATPAVSKLAQALGVVDHPGVRKVHQGQIPRIGGVAIALATAVALVAGSWWDRRGGLGQLGQLGPLLAASLLVFVLGLVDDLQGLKARVKLLGQLVAAGGLCALGVRIDSLSIDGLFHVELGWAAWPLTVVWMVGITNAVNLIDGLDGLAGGICAVACASIFLFALHSGQVLMALLMLALLGALTGFLIFNFNPARVFMGDCGSLFLGFLLAAASVQGAATAQTLVGLALPALALGVPIFDTLFSMLRRILQRRGVMSPDRSHLHHRLLDMGLRQRHVVLLLYGLTILAAGLGLFMMVTRDISTLVVFVCVVMLLMLIFRFVGVVSLRATLRSLRRNLRLAHLARQGRADFEQSQLRLRQAQDFADWWDALCAAAPAFRAARICMEVVNRDGTVRTLAWEDPDGGQGQCVHLTVPVPDRRGDRRLDLKLDLLAGDSLELAGQRAALIARLVEENGLRALKSAAS